MAWDLEGDIGRLVRTIQALDDRIVKLEAFMAATRKDEWRRRKYGLRGQIAKETTLAEATEILRRAEGLD